MKMKQCFFYVFETDFLLLTNRKSWESARLRTKKIAYGYQKRLSEYSLQKHLHFKRSCTSFKMVSTFGISRQRTYDKP